MPQPLILVTNDDGVHAEGIRALAAAIEDLGGPIEVVNDVLNGRNSVFRKQWNQVLGIVQYHRRGIAGICLADDLSHRGDIVIAKNMTVIQMTTPLTNPRIPPRCLSKSMIFAFAIQLLSIPATTNDTPQRPT